MKPYLPVALLVVLAGCPGPSGNPSRLWLDHQTGSEVLLKLSDAEPEPW
jgi:hypothetical protein